MSREAQARKVYEARMVKDALARLAERIDMNDVPFSDLQLKTLATRCRDAFRNPEKNKERLVKYKAHLAKDYGAEVVERVALELADINDTMGYEEK